MEEHWYYLHTNGELIHKRTWPGEDGSDFVKKIWRCDPTDRENAWTIIIESLGLGANVDRIRELAAKWGCDARDFTQFLIRRPNPSEEIKRGGEAFLRQVAKLEPDAYWDWLGSTPKGSEPDFSKMPTPAAA